VLRFPLGTKYTASLRRRERKAQQNVPVSNIRPTIPPTTPPIMGPTLVPFLTTAVVVGVKLRVPDTGICADDGDIVFVVDAETEEGLFTIGAPGVDETLGVVGTDGVFEDEDDAKSGGKVADDVEAEVEKDESELEGDVVADDGTDVEEDGDVDSPFRMTN
jgi:hypothetical protein